jgi:hypothetical protein
MSLIDDKNRSKLDAKIKETKQAIRNDHQQWLTKRKDHIMSLGNVFVTFVSNPESVCEEIKNCLHEEIADKLISARDIERYCPDKWKKKTKPKNDKLSFSKQVEKKAQQQIAATQEGRIVIINEPPSGTDTPEGVNHLYDESKQNEFAEPKQESTATPSFNDEIKPSPIKETGAAAANNSDKADLKAANKFLNELTLPSRELHQYVASQRKKGKKEVWLTIETNPSTGEIVYFKTGRISELLGKNSLEVKYD